MSVVRAIGLMSGTSLDGVDAAVIETDGERIAAFGPVEYRPYRENERAVLRQALAEAVALTDRTARPGILAEAEALTTRVHAETVEELLLRRGLKAADIAVIGFHGQTVIHKPAEKLTVQIGDGAGLAKRLGIAVVHDFRAADVAVGGQGAPLVPAFHRRLFHSSNEHRVIVNIGGIANITNLPCEGMVTGFDCGPGNALMDEWMLVHQGKHFDADGAWARTGAPLENSLKRMFSNDFFAAPPPKSTGRERFNLAWVKSHLSGAEAPQDVQATLLELTAQGITSAIMQHCAGAQAAILCGGGAHNGALM